MGSVADFAVDIVAGSSSCLHGDQLLIAYCIPTLISSSRPSQHLTHSHAMVLFSVLLVFSFMVSWVGSPRIIHIPFSWLGGSSAQNHDFFLSYLCGSCFFFRRIVIDHFRIMDSGLASWELQEYLVRAPFFLSVPDFLLEK